MPKSDVETTKGLKPDNALENQNTSSQQKDEVSSGSGPKLAESEIRRKILHMSPGIAPFLLAITPHPGTLEIKDLVFVSFIIVVFIALFLSFRKKVERPGETNLLSTVYSYAAVVATVLFLFREHPEFASVVTVVIAFGDSAAHIGGTLFGKKKLPWNQDKSWMGMFAFILVAAPFAALAFYMEARDPSVSIALAVVCGLTAAVAGCLAESIDTPLTDNLRVGVASAIGVIISFFAFQDILV